MKYTLTILLLLVFSVCHSQVTFNTIPLDKQLVGRDVSTNLGDIVIDGQVGITGTKYDAIIVELFRDNILHNTFSQTLSYNLTNAPFNFNIPITAELVNYSLIIYGNLGGTLTIEKTVKEIVAGDVYIIQGQSNAEAERYNGFASSNESDFIRVYANGTIEPFDLQNNDAWYIGQGDGKAYTNGNTGQWGLKLARRLIDTFGRPIAIFNGATPGRQIKYFQAAPDYQTSIAGNYGRLYYRLDKNGLRDHVRAVIWSQGESDGGSIGNLSLTQYKNYLLALKNNWLTDYQNIEKIYIFQTKNGCGSPLHQIKEAQRQIAIEDVNVSIMSVAAAVHNDDDCHFVYANGYELFGERIFRLVERDIYNMPTSDDIDAPMIQSANMIDNTTLVVETDAVSLSINTIAEDFLLENAGSATITNITTSSNNIIFTLSESPGLTATISYLGHEPDPGNFIINQQGIEILGFDKYPIKIVSPLMITQYYEGDGNDQWVEVKNISSSSVPANLYKLALYKDTKTPIGTIDTTAPDEFVEIDAMTPGQVRIYKNTNAVFPGTSNLGGVGEPTSVCTFDGNDVILISQSVGIDCYNKRVDIMGVVPSSGVTPPFWGMDKGFIKGCGTIESASEDFDTSTGSGGEIIVNDYIELTIAEVNTAADFTNIELGTQNIGTTVWTTSWDNGVSDRTRTTIISGTYENSNGTFESCNLTIDSGAIINLDDEGGGSNYILVEKDLTVNGSFFIGDTESLITVNPNAVITGNIQKNEITTALNNFRDFTYWSSPVDTTIENAFVNPLVGTGVDPNRIFKWDIPTTNPDFWGNWSLASGPMEAGRGYISEAPNNIPDLGTHSVIFKGTPNNGKIDVIVGYNADGGGDSDFNLIGNPYPSAINIDDFILSSNNNIMDGTIWLWTHNTAIDASGQFLGFDYATYNLSGGIITALPAPSNPGGSPPTGKIASGQGFFVRTTNSGTLSFENSMRLQGQNTQFFRAPDTKDLPIQEKDRVWLNVESNTGGAFSQILVGFFDNATDGYDRGYDGKRLGGGWIDFYSKIDTDRYAVQGLPSFTIDKEVQIGFDTYISDAMTYKISMYNVEGVLNDNEIYLVDHELNTVHDLKLTDYEFDVNGEGYFPDRFTLQFTSSVLAVDTIELNNNFVVINEGDTLRLKSTTVIAHLKVYDMMGRLLIDKKPNDSEFAINTHSIKNGTVLILNATFNNGAEVSKKTFK